MNEEQTPKSFIQIIFADIDSVNMPVAPAIMANALQVLAASEFLRMVGQSMLAKETSEKIASEKAQADRNRIIVPG